MPYLAMWIFSIALSHVCDWAMTSTTISNTVIRKIANCIGQFGPALALAIAGFTGCHKWTTVMILTIGVGFNGAIFSGFKVNHLDISPRFAGILMSFTNCLANVVGLLAPVVAGYMVHGTVNFVLLIFSKLIIKFAIVIRLF